MKTLIFTVLMETIPISNAVGYTVGIGVAILILAYLAYVLFNPEKF